ncbi:hypothetical protein HK405_015822, partial [Cladochytrium tenue]
AAEAMHYNGPEQATRAQKWEWIMNNGNPGLADQLRKCANLSGSNIDFDTSNKMVVSAIVEAYAEFSSSIHKFVGLRGQRIVLIQFPGGLDDGMQRLTGCVLTQLARDRGFAVEVSVEKPIVSPP